MGPARSRSRRTAPPSAFFTSLDSSRLKPASVPVLGHHGVADLCERCPPPPTRTCKRPGLRGRVPSFLQRWWEAGGGSASPEGALAVNGSLRGCKNNILVSPCAVNNCWQNNEECSLKTHRLVKLFRRILRANFASRLVLEHHADVSGDKGHLNLSSENAHYETLSIYLAGEAVDARSVRTCGGLLMRVDLSQTGSGCQEAGSQCSRG